MRKFLINVNGKGYEVDVEEIKDGVVAQPMVAAPVAAAPAAPKAAPAAAPVAAGEGEKVEAPMPGNIMKVNVKVGDTVAEGDVLLVLEAMKMENDISAPKAGKVTSVCVQQGATVDTGDVLVTIA
ncbi:MAG: biotin/lipoyl-containing protein [Eubacteriales bacterium]|jgi:biotin carboxyl carrier protein